MILIKIHIHSLLRQKKNNSLLFCISLSITIALSYNVDFTKRYIHMLEFTCIYEANLYYFITLELVKKFKSYYFINFLPWIYYAFRTETAIDAKVVACVGF